jgi:excinuclease ABC subunit C
MTKKQLYEKARRLPMLPGVYIIRDKRGEIIYIGKAKRLRVRVSQYFRAGNVHRPKVTKMVESAYTFDVIVTNSETEALTLECSQIKMHSPKYNILLKDDKGYSFIKITEEEYPRITAELQATDKNCRYLGPYMSSFAVREMVDTTVGIFKLPTCNRVFPRDLGKNRPCLNYYIGKCMGLCSGKISKNEYNSIIDSAIHFITQDTDKMLETLERDMERAAEDLNFEHAARIRDQIIAIKKLSAGQNVIDENLTSHDFIAVAGSRNNCCVAVLRFRNGHLIDKKEHVFFGEDNADDVRDEFLVQFYAVENPPRNVMLDKMPIDESIVEYIDSKVEYKVKVQPVMRGDNLKIIKMAYTNAVDRLARETGRIDKNEKYIDELGNMLGLGKPANLIESYDISNWGDGTSVAGMIVFEGGKPQKSGYRRFKIKTVAGVDDYASMAEALTRRISEYDKGTKGQFSQKPDAIFLDGGKGQLSAVLAVTKDTSFEDVPIFGMVKDSKHRTRAMVSKDGEIAIAMHKGIFKFVTEIQDEVHRFSIEYMRKTAKKKSYSVTLEKIYGIGQKKSQAIMKELKTLANVKNASTEDLIKVKGISKKDAENIYNYFHGEN